MQLNTALYLCDIDKLSLEERVLIEKLRRAIKKRPRFLVTTKTNRPESTWEVEAVIIENPRLHLHFRIFVEGDMSDIPVTQGKRVVASLLRGESLSKDLWNEVLQGTCNFIEQHNGGTLTMEC